MSFPGFEGENIDLNRHNINMLSFHKILKECITWNKFSIVLDIGFIRKPTTTICTSLQAHDSSFSGKFNLQNTLFSRDELKSKINYLQLSNESFPHLHAAYLRFICIKKKII